VKALVEADSDRILGFTAFGVGAGEILAAVQIAMIAGLPYTALRDAVLTHPTLVEGLIPLFSSAASAHNVVETRRARSPRHEVNCNRDEKNRNWCPVVSRHVSHLADAARRLDEKRAAIEIETKTGTQKERAETRLP